VRRLGCLRADARLTLVPQVCLQDDASNSTGEGSFFTDIRETFSEKSKWPMKFFRFHHGF